jgi:hypothetical protein
MEATLDKFDTRIRQLEKLGFVHTRVGLSSDTLVSAFLYHQIEEPTEEEWVEFIAEMEAKKAKA